MKKSLSIILIMTFFLSICFIGKPQSAYAERPAKGIFIDSIFGLATGALIGAAVTLADSNAKGDDWGKNIGIGAKPTGISHLNESLTRMKKTSTI